MPANLNLSSQRFEAIQPDGLSGSGRFLLRQLSNRWFASKNSCCLKNGENFTRRIKSSPITSDWCAHREVQLKLRGSRRRAALDLGTSRDLGIFDFGAHATDVR
jgi:hypothetical protein